MNGQTRPYDSPAPPYEQWPSVPGGPLRQILGDDEIAAMILDDAASKDSRGIRSTCVPSMDDIEAAQALEGLRADIKRPAQVRQPDALPSKVDPALSRPQNTEQLPQQPEPLLSILTSQHPLLSTAVNRSLSAYTTSKSYSPSFKYGAEFVERHIGSPVVSTVGTASRISGVETGFRWWLQRRNLNSPNRSKKRRLEDIDCGHSDGEKGLRDSKAQTNIQESFSELTFAEPLPPYDDQRSPKYEEKQPMDDRGEVSRSRLREWQQRIIIYTSGLGASLSEESLRSLRHCLEWLRWANRNINRSIRALHEILDRSCAVEQGGSPEDSQKITQSGKTSSDLMRIPQYVDALDQSVRSILKEAIRVVNQFTANALPDNARQLVRKYITSFPLSFRIVNTLFQQNPEFGFPGIRSSQPSENDSRIRRAILFAREGLNMLVQITGVLDGTIISADRWRDRLERSEDDEARDDVDEASANSATDVENLNEAILDGEAHLITTDESITADAISDENNASRSTAIMTPGILSTLKKKDNRLSKIVSEGGALIKSVPTGDSQRSRPPRSESQVNGASTNGNTTERNRAYDASGHRTSQGGTPVVPGSIMVPPALSGYLSGWNPNYRPLPPAYRTVENVMNGPSRNETQTNGHITDEHETETPFGQIPNIIPNIVEDIIWVPSGHEAHAYIRRHFLRDNRTLRENIPRDRIPPITHANSSEFHGPVSPGTTRSNPILTNGVAGHTDSEDDDSVARPSTSAGLEDTNDTTTGGENSDRSNSGG